METKVLPYFALFVLNIVAWPAVPAPSTYHSPPLSVCTSGETFVHNNIIYDCVGENGQTHAKPIACAPEGDKNKSVVKPGEIFSNEHFKYKCEEENNALVLKVINCIDSTGMVVEIGGFFTMEDDSGNHQTTECLGDYFKVKKTVLQWTKCTLPSGEKVTEGNFQVEPLSSNMPSKPFLQKGEIISCIRNGKEVSLKCTGCVTEHTSIHVGVAGYVEVNGQWTQCRRTSDGCRLINVTRNYVDCQLQGSAATYQNGVYFNDTNGISTYYCNHGVVSKQGCTIDGQWALVGEVVYASSGEPFLCDSSPTFSTFNGLKGCTLPDGTAKKFQEIWRDRDAMKRCYWKNGHQGPAKELIVSYACIRGEEIIAENKVIQRENGVFEKCVRGMDDELTIRKLSEKELMDFIKRKTLRLDLTEYYANGGKGNIETFAAEPKQANDATTSSILFSTTPKASESLSVHLPLDDNKKQRTSETPQDYNNLATMSLSTSANSSSTAGKNCKDLVSFCPRLASYCPDFDRYQVIDAETGKDSVPSAIVELQEIVGKLFKDKAADESQPISPCEAHFLTHQRKLKLLVDIICPKTCNSCLQPNQSERVLSRLQDTSRCG